MATYSSILDWRIPRTEEPGGLQSLGLQKDTTVGLFVFFFFFHGVNYYCLFKDEI